jgi:hypothetical protein
MNDGIGVFKILKRTATHADVFAAAGLADLLASIPDAGPVRLRERDAQFEIHTSRPLREVDWVRVPQTPGYPFLKANEKVSVPSGVTDFVDYKAEKAKAERRKQLLGSGRTKGKRRTLDAEIQQLVQQEQLRDDWRLLQVLNTLQGDETANRVYETIVSREGRVFSEEMATALVAVSEDRPSGLGWRVSAVQLFTPVAAKGYGRLKPYGTDRGDKTKEQWTDPFLEWLKYRGYFQVACPFFQGAKAEHIRLLCPVPGDISLQALASVTRELRTAGIYGGPPKMDALAVLRLAEILVRHSEEYHDPAAEVYQGLFLQGRTPAEVISGIMVTHYQSLGNAKAVSAMSTLALPGWFLIESREGAEEWLAILDEHQRIIRGLQDDHSDEIGLLIAYRRFLEKRGEGAMWALLEFIERYGPFLMRANGTRENGRVRWTPRFTDAYIRRILMGMDGRLSQIVNDIGFEAVARAVRQATVTAQNRRARYKAGFQKEDTWREIRYDLLHDLHRTRKVPGNAFVECVMEFLSHYNRENARRREEAKNPKAAPASVSDEELKAFLALVDHHGASLVGALLAAYGSCKEKWEPEETEVPDSAQTHP